VNNQNHDNPERECGGGQCVFCQRHAPHAPTLHWLTYKRAFFLNLNQRGAIVYARAGGVRTRSRAGDRHLQRRPLPIYGTTTTRRCALDARRQRVASLDGAVLPKARTARAHATRAKMTLRSVGAHGHPIRGADELAKFLMHFESA